MQDNRSNPPEEYDLMLISISDEESIELNRLEDMSKENNHIPILIINRDTHDIQVYGFSVAERKWKLTALDKEAFSLPYLYRPFHLYGPFQISDNAMILPKGAFSLALLCHEITSKNGHTPLEPLNDMQKHIIDVFLSFPMEDITDSCKDTHSAIKALQAMVDTSPLSKEDIQDFEEEKVLETINQIRSIFSHPYPQNRSDNYPYFDPPKGDDTIIVYKDDNGNPAIEKKGLLSLTAYNSRTALPVTKEAVETYIRQLVNVAVLALEEQLKNTRPSSTQHSPTIFKKEPAEEKIEPAWYKTLLGFSEGELFLYCNSSKKSKPINSIQVFLSDDLRNKLSDAKQSEIIKNGSSKIAVALHKKGDDFLAKLGPRALHELHEKVTQKNQGDPPGYSRTKPK